MEFDFDSNGTLVSICGLPLVPEEFPNLELSKIPGFNEMMDLFYQGEILFEEPKQSKKPSEYIHAQLELYADPQTGGNPQ